MIIQMFDIESRLESNHKNWINWIEIVEFVSSQNNSIAPCKL